MMKIFFSLLLISLCLTNYSRNLLHNNHFNPSDTSIVLLFAHGQYDLDSINRSKIQECYTKLIQNDSSHFYTVAIAGYTDDIGSDSFNLELAKKRASASMKYLYKIGNGALKKKGIIDVMTSCYGIRFISWEYDIPVNVGGFGEKNLKGIVLDSMSRIAERKVILNFKDDRNKCLGVFGTCYLPFENIVIQKDSSIFAYINKGDIESYTTGTRLPECKYDSTSVFTVQIKDSLLNANQICNALTDAYKEGSEPKEIKIGSIDFLPEINGNILTNRVCEDGLQSFEWNEVLISRKLINFNKFRMYQGNDTISYKNKEDFLQMLLPLRNKQHIEVRIVPPSIKKLSLLVKGKIKYAISSTDKEYNCEVVNESPQKIRSLFSTKYKYQISAFNNQPFLKLSYGTQTAEILLSKLKFNSKKNQYYLSKSMIKQIFEY